LKPQWKECTLSLHSVILLITSHPGVSKCFASFVTLSSLVFDIRSSVGQGKAEGDWIKYNTSTLFCQ